MEEKWPTWSAVAAMVFSFSTLALVMFRVDPFEAGLLEKSLFFGSLFIGLGSLIYLLIFRRN